jgi:hypothetical protein
MSARLRWIVAVAAVLALTAQAWAATAAWNHTRPRLPALAAVAPLLDQAIAALVSATGERAAVAIAGVVAYTGCEKTFLAKGSRFNRAADLYTDPGTEDALIATVADHLPAGDHPTRTTPIGGGPAPLTADLGSGVHLRLSQLGDGWLQAVAETDCRTGHPNPDPASGVDPPGRDAVDHLLTALGTATDTWHTDTIACAGGHLTTLSAISRTTDTDNLPRRLAALVPAAARRFVSPANRLAWHDATGSMIVAASDDGTHITVQHTTHC